MNNKTDNGQVHGRNCGDGDLESGKIIETDAKGKSDETKRKILKRPVRFYVRQVTVMIFVCASLAVIAAINYYFLGWLWMIYTLIQVVVFALLIYLIITKKYRWFYVAAVTAPRDIYALTKYVQLIIQVKSFQRRNLTLSEIFQINVRKHPNKHAVLYEDQSWTFQEIEDYSNKIANVFKNHGYKKGDVVALFLENKPEFIATWIGLSKLGVIIPLINTNLKHSTLVHSITVAKSQAIIFGSELTGEIRDILDKIESKVALYQLYSKNQAQEGHDTVTDQRFKNLTGLLNEAPSTAVEIPEKVGHHDHLVYIYTSGTTGLPKAAVISNSRFIFIAAAIHWLSNFKCSDRFYTPLPLYHTAGGCMSTGQMLIFGSTLIIRKKFSASAYFADIRKYDATVAQYIGEMCRYVLAVPPKDIEKQHKLRMIYGNGLRPQIWKEFVERFNIPKVAEFYGATEGNANIVNVDNTVGAIGFVSRIIPSVYPISIIRVNSESGEPLRNNKGLCMLCKPHEPGVFIGKILPHNPSRAFLGYVDKEASKKKVVYDVFRKGDSAFLSGDILVADEFGNLFFKDRTGDTFRWKGENVSTSEVEAVLSNLVNYKDVVVYGVEIRGQEGRAGMAAILDPDETLDFKNLAEGVKKVLPSYARPIFLRILNKLDLTGTYKLKKNDLQKDGFDPKKTTDKYYYLDSCGNYASLTENTYEQIHNGTIRL